MRATSLAIVLIALLLWPASVSSNEDQPIPEDCSFHLSNPYFDQLRLKKVHLRDAPFEESQNFCGGEWHLHKTCCYSNQMIENAKQDNRSITRAFKTVIHNFKKIHQSVHEVKFMVRQEVVMPTTDASSDIVQLNSKAKAAIQDRIINEFFVDLSGMDQQGFDRFNQSTRSCWENMIRYRSAAICNSCSGRASVFFQGPRSILLQASTCMKKLRRNLVDWILECRCRTTSTRINPTTTGKFSAIQVCPRCSTDTPTRKKRKMQSRSARSSSISEMRLSSSSSEISSIQSRRKSK